MFRIYYDASPSDIQKLNNLKLALKKFKPTDEVEVSAKKQMLSLFSEAMHYIKSGDADDDAFLKILEIGKIMRKFRIKDQDIAISIKQITGIAP